MKTRYTDVYDMIKGAFSPKKAAEKMCKKVAALNKKSELGSSLTQLRCLLDLDYQLLAKEAGFSTKELLSLECGPDSQWTKTDIKKYINGLVNSLSKDL